LSIQSGPPLVFSVFGDCNTQFGFQEQQVCAFGVCHIWIPTLAKHSGQDTLYVTLEGKGYPLIAERVRNDNSLVEKPTAYTLTVVKGTANCGAAPSTGFCAGTSDGFNVWSDITSSAVWSNVYPALADNQAECLYDELINYCPTPSQECLKWLKVFSCLESFPQCDSNGYQVPMCVDVCDQVTEHCGGFASHLEFSCCSDRYVQFSNATASSSTCYNIPPPPPPPTVVVPVRVGDPSSSLPPPLEVPVFSTIFAYFAPASFVPGKEAEVAKQVLVSSSPIIAPLISLVTLLVVLLA